MKRTILLFIVAAALFVRSSGNSVVGTEYIQDTSRLVINADSNQIAHYAVAGSRSDLPEQVSISQKKNKKKNRKAEEKKIYIKSKKIDPAFLEGIDIVAFGADPSWSLDINHNKAIQFSVPGLDAPVAFSPVPPTLSGDSIVYNIVSENEKMRIILARGACSDVTGKNVYDYKVTVNYKSKIYKGCGTVMNADGSLTGTWLLKNIEGAAARSEKPPYMVVDLAAEKFYGYTGCNNFSGSARMRGERVCFSDIKFESQRECNNYDENILIDAMIKCNGFSINEGKLSMKQDGRPVIFFQRLTEEYL